MELAAEDMTDRENILEFDIFHKKTRHVGLARKGHELPGP